MTLYAGQWVFITCLVAVNKSKKYLVLRIGGLFIFQIFRSYLPK